MRNPEDTKYVWDEKNFNIIQNSMKTHFDKQVDKIRETLFERIKDIKENPNLFEESKQEYINILHEQMNKMEFAREVHNRYVLTGEVIIPK